MSALDEWARVDGLEYLDAADWATIADILERVHGKVRDGTVSDDDLMVLRAIGNKARRLREEARGTRDRA